MCGPACNIDLMTDIYESGEEDESIPKILNKILEEMKLLRIDMRQMTEKLDRPTPPGPEQGQVTSGERVTWTTIPKIQVKDFTNGISVILQGKEWGDLVQHGTCLYRDPWVTWVGKCVNHPATCPFWAAQKETTEQHNQKEFIISKVAQCILTIMTDKLQIIFPNEGHGIIYEDEMISGTDKPILNQVRIYKIQVYFF